jgi:hypothetical protein
MYYNLICILICTPMWAKKFILVKSGCYSYGFPHKVALLVVLRFPAQSGPFCTLWFRQFTKNVTKTGHTDRSHPHSTEHDTQPIAYLICKQAVPCQTRGGI